MLDLLFLVVPLTLAFIPFGIVARAYMAYLQNPKGFNQYTSENWLSPFTKLAHCLEMIRRHPIHRTRRLYLNHSQNKKQIIRMGPNWISFGRARAARDIYGYQSPCYKSKIYDRLQEGGSHLVNITDKSTHKMRRGMVSHFYAPKHQQSWWERWTEDTNADFMKAIDAHCTKPLPAGQNPTAKDLSMELVHWGFTWAAEVIIKIGLSKDLHFLDRGDSLYEITDKNGQRQEVSIVRDFHSAVRAIAQAAYDPKRATYWINFMRIFSKEYEHNFQKGKLAETAFTQLVHERMERYNSGEKLNDLFSPWLETRSGDEPNISTKDRVAEVTSMVGATIDAPGGCISLVIYHLCKYPETMRKLREELSTVLPRSRCNPTWEQVKQLPYLRACIDEAMRLQPAVATDLVRRTPPEGCIIDGVSVPGNTDVSISSYTSHRDPDVFPDPEVYKPERWIDNKGTDLMQEMLHAWLPFTAGYRTCMGKNVSAVLQMTVTAMMVHNFEWALPSQDFQIPLEEWFNLWPHECPTKVWHRDFSVQV